MQDTLYSLRPSNSLVAPLGAPAAAPANSLFLKIYAERKLLPDVEEIAAPPAPPPILTELTQAVAFRRAPGGLRIGKTQPILVAHRARRLADITSDIPALGNKSIRNWLEKAKDLTDFEPPIEITPDMFEDDYQD